MIDFSQYILDEDYPSPPERPCIPERYYLHDEEVVSRIRAYEEAHAVWLAAVYEHKAKYSDLRRKFESDALSAVGLTDHPAAKRALVKAWNDSHNHYHSTSEYEKLRNMFDSLEEIARLLLR